jgi:small-conductance mechanosensitive channel
MEVAEIFQWLESRALVTPVIALAAALGALVAALLGTAALRRLCRFSVLLAILAQRISRPIVVVAPLIALQLVWAGAPDDLAWVPRVQRITALLLIGALTWLAMRAVAAVAEAVVALHPSNVSDNLEARRVQTQTRVLARTLMFFVFLLGAGAALMMFPGVRQIGTSLLASAGVAGLAAGIAAKPVLGNLIAGLQIALTQPIRLDDVVIMEGEWGRIEEIGSSYIVVKLWDQRRLVVPLQWVIEHPFQNWTRRDSALLGTVLLWVDYGVPLAPLREELARVCESAPEWDRRVALVQVVDTSERAMQLRALVSAADASKAWDLRCRVREALIDFLQRTHPEGLPRLRATMESRQPHAARPPAPPPLHAGKGDSTAIREPQRPLAHAPPASGPKPADVQALPEEKEPAAQPNAR